MKKPQRLLEADHKSRYTGMVSILYHFMSKMLTMPVAIIVYFIFAINSGIYISCPFRCITGLKCPGCGLTHLVIHLVRGQILEAFASNPVLMIYILYMFGISIASRIYHHCKHPLIHRFLNWNSTYKELWLVLMMAWGFVRNILGV